MKENWVEFDGDTDEEINAYLNTTFDGDYRDDVNRLKNLTLDPIFTSGDDRYFDVINRSTHANYHIDLTELYDNYYSVQMVNGDRTNVNIQLPNDDTNTGGNNGGSNNGGSNNGGDTTTLPGPTDNNTDDDDDLFGVLPDEQFIDEAEADESTQNQLKLILLIIVIALLFGLYVISRTNDSDELLNSQSTVVEKFWDDDEISESSSETSSKPSESTENDESVDIKDKVASAMKSSGLSAVRLFTAIDQTNDGYVSRREIRTAVNTLLKDSVKVSDIDAMLETFDDNGDGVISLDEFLSVMEKHQPSQFVPVLPDLKPPKKN